MRLPDKFDKTNALVAMLVLLISFVVYYLTKAPTFSLWDCAEFVAVSAILGIPHPPGTPFYVIMGHLFSALPIASDIAVRINLLSVVSSAFSAMFAYLIAVRILRNCFKNDSVTDRIIIYAGSACGAFFLAFSITNWNNSVEAEVYGLSMVIFNIIFWLTLVYHANRETPFGDRVLILIVYLALLGVNAHLATYLIIPSLILFYILKGGTPVRYWYIMGGTVVFMLYTIIAFSSKADELPYFVPILIIFMFYLFYIFSHDKIPKIYILVSGGFLLTLLPAVAYLTNNDSESIFTNVSIMSWICRLLYLGGGLWLIIKYKKAEKNNPDKNYYLISSVFLFVAALMLGMNNLKQYAFYMSSIKPYTLFLFLGFIIILVILIIVRKYINWIYLIAFGSVSSVILGVMPFVYGLIYGGMTILLLGLVFKLPKWRQGLVIILVAMLGYSINLFTPIRSSQQPMINENNPSRGIDVMINFIERKQYGSESMVERMFDRRGEWKNQFGNYQRMGFWNFFTKQYGISGMQFLIPFLIGVFGIWEVTRRKGKLGTPFILLLLITSVGLILYMNFADGTRNVVIGRDHLEVRDRDYFFTPAYMFFGLAIGMGIAFVVKLLKDSVEKFHPVTKNAVVYSSFVLFLTPVIPFSNNYYYADRSNNYIPYDYATNLLYNADENAILFTAEDNDTFSLWCIQEAYKYRKDVAVVNLSLANLDWYIKQIRDNLGVSLSWTDKQIEDLRPIRDQTGAVYRISDLVMTEIIKENINKRPINFSFTVSLRTIMFMGQPLDSMLSIEGFTFKLNRQKVGLHYKVDETYDYLMDSTRFKSRSIADPSVFKDEASLRVSGKYVRTFIGLADTLNKMNDHQRVEKLLKRSIEKIPHGIEAVNYLASFYTYIGENEKTRELIENSDYIDKKQFKYIWANNLVKNKELVLAESVYNELINDYPDFKAPVDNLIRLYLDRQQPIKIRELILGWLESHPDDQNMKQMLDLVNQEIRRIDTTGKNH